MSTLEPNLKEYTLEEAADLGAEWLGLLEQGKEEEAEMLAVQIPLLPLLANNLKNDIGIEEMIKQGINLSEAVKYYGKEWLKS